MVGEEANDPDVLRGYYRQMVLIREFELRASEMYTRAKIGGYCHLNVGEEATVVGLMDALEPRDYLFNTYRDHGYALARGLEPGRIMAELFGKTAGVSGGWGGSMHLFDVSTRLMGGYGIVGGQIPPATGAALAVTYRDEPGPDAEAVMCVMGDGATNIGAFHESLNLAAVWRLPIVYVIVNNGLGMATTVEAASGEPELYKRGGSYRIPGLRVDGNDVLATYAVTTAALTAAREGQGPTLIEAFTYRMGAHTTSDDPTRYRLASELEAWKLKDPLERLKAFLYRQQLADSAFFADLEAEADALAARLRAGCLAMPDPDPDSIFAHVYAEMPAPLQAQREEFAAYRASFVPEPAGGQR